MSLKSSKGAKKGKSLSSSSLSSSRKKQKQPPKTQNDDLLLNDSDSDDDDDINELLNTKVFTPHKDKQKRPGLVIGKRYSIDNNNNDAKKKKGGDQKAMAMTTKEIEAEAKRLVASIDLHLVENTDSLDELGWWHRQCKQREEYYPVRKCREDEAAEEIVDKPLKQNHMYVRLLGWKYESACNFEQMPKRQWQNFVAGDHEERISEKTEATKKNTVQNNHRHQPQSKYNNNDDNERKLKMFLSLPVINKKFQDDPIGLKLEELAIRAQWDKVRQRQHEKDQQPLNGKRREVETDDNDAAEEDAKVVAASAAEATTAAKMQQLQSPKRKQVSKESSPASAEGKSVEDDDTSSDDDSDDGDDILSPGKKRKKEKLRDGDVIEYYDPIGVAGKKEWLKRATILGIQPYNRIPLNLDNGQLGLDKHCMIKLVQRRLRGKLVDVNTERSTRGFKRLRDYGLKTCGTTELVALKGMAQHAKMVRQSHREGVAKLWEEHSSGKCNDDGKGKNSGEPCKTSAEETMTADGDKKPLAIISQEEEQEDHEQECAPEVKVPAWKKHLEELLKLTIEKKKANKRCRPPMEPQQLELILKVWQKLQQRLDRTGESTKEILDQLAKALGISFYRVDAVMHGDEKKKCSTPDKNEVLEVISKWLESTEANEFINKQGEGVQLPLNRRKRPLQSTSDPKMPSSINKRKRLQQEDAAVAVEQDEENSSSSLVSKRTQPIHREEEPRRKNAATRRKRRLTTSVDVGISSKGTSSMKTKSSASTSRRRQSCAPDIETARKSYKKAVPPTDPESSKDTRGNKRKAAPLSYVPPSVTTRRKRKSAALSSGSVGTEDCDSMMPTKKKPCLKAAAKDDDDSEKKKALSQIERAQSEIKILIEHEKKNIETKSRRYRPHMTIEQLELGSTFWDEIGRHAEDPTSDDSVHKCIVHLSQEFEEVSHYKLIRFLTGDREKRLREAQIKNVHGILETWQNKQK